MQEGNVTVVIHRFPCSLVCGDCMLQFHVGVCEIEFQFATYGNWKDSKRHASSYSIVFASLQSLPCIFCTNETKKKHLNAEICLSYSNWFDHLKFLFLPSKLFISSWSLWSNSIHPDKSSRVKNSKACRRTKYGKLNSIASGNKIQMLKVKIGLFLLKLEIHCMTGQKVKFTWKDQNTNRFVENLVCGK